VINRRETLALAGAASALIGMSAAGGRLGSALAAQQYKMVSIPKLRAPWFNEFEKGLLKAAKEYGVNAYQQAPESADEAEQVRLISDAINQGVNALLVVPNDAASIVPVLAKAQEKHIVTLTHESPQQKNADVDIEMIDNKAFGEKAIDLLAKALDKPEGKYAIYVGSLTVPAHNIWADAAIAHAKTAYPNLVPVADRYPVGEDQSAAHQNSLDVLTAHPDLKGFLCFGSQGAPGAAQAVNEKGLIGKVEVIGTTSPNQAAQYLKDGSMYASIVWDPAEAAYAMVYMAKLILDGKKSEIGPNIDIPTIGKPLSFKGNTLIYDRPLIVTKDNLDKYNTF
jgi:simple sugar transport system substrate-binding protein